MTKASQGSAVVLCTIPGSTMNVQSLTGQSSGAVHNPRINYGWPKPHRAVQWCCAQSQDQLWIAKASQGSPVVLCTIPGQLWMAKASQGSPVVLCTIPGSTMDDQSLTGQCSGAVHNPRINYGWPKPHRAVQWCCGQSQDELWMAKASQGSPVVLCTIPGSTMDGQSLSGQSSGAVHNPRINYGWPKPKSLF